MLKVSRGIVAVGSLVALTFGMSPAKADFEPTLDHTELCSPDDPDFFHLNINNSYFPLLPGQLSVFLDDSDPNEPLGLRIEVLDDTENLYRGQDRIVTRVVKETEWFDSNQNGDVDEDEELIEISYNYYAQTDDGSVCYFGEAVDIFEENGVSHEGSWRADEEPNAPGIFMPANPRRGDVYLQEDAPETALDVSEVTQFTTVRAGGSKYKKAMKTVECNLFEDPECEDIGTKAYAPGKGIVLDGDLELTDFDSGN